MEPKAGGSQENLPPPPKAKPCAKKPRPADPAATTPGAKRKRKAVPTLPPAPPTANGIAAEVRNPFFRHVHSRWRGGDSGR